MKKLIFIILFIFSNFVSFSQSILQSNDTIKFWDFNDTLIFDDFKLNNLPAELDTNHVGLCSSGWYVEYDGKYIVSIRTNMRPYRSYLKLNSDSLTLLHETTHFRMHELYLRYFFDSLLICDESIFLKDYSMIYKLKDYYWNKCNVDQEEFDLKVYGGDYNISDIKERELCNAVLHQLSETEDNLEEIRDFFLKINTTSKRYIEYFNFGDNAFNNKDYEKSVILWKKALDLIPDHNNNQVIMENIDIANNNQKEEKYFYLIQEGEKAFNDKDYEKSVILWKKALDLIPDHNNNQVIMENIDIANNNQKEEKYFYLIQEGEKAFNDKDYEKSVILWKKALDLIPDHKNNQVLFKNINIANNNHRKN
jgi:tetratricopeptide (TPR) repeat protein